MSKKTPGVSEQLRRALAGESVTVKGTCGCCAYWSGHDDGECTNTQSPKYGGELVEAPDTCDHWEPRGDS